MTWTGKYRSLLVRHALLFGGWMALVLIAAFLPLPTPADRAYIILGKSVLFFLPAPGFALILAVRKWSILRNIKSDETEGLAAFIDQEQDKLTSALQIMQLIFLILLTSALMVTLVYRSDAAIWLMSMTIQWMVFTVIHFTEHYYTANLLREMRSRHK